MRARAIDVGVPAHLAPVAVRVGQAIARRRIRDCRSTLLGLYFGCGAGLMAPPLSLAVLGSNFAVMKIFVSRR